MELLPSIEACWMKKGEVLNIPTLGYTARCNFFITLFWPKKTIVWNCFKRRRNIEFRKHLSSVVASAKRYQLKKVIIFADHAKYHTTPEVKKFIQEHPVLKVKMLGKKDPNSNPVECHVNRRMYSAVSVNRPYVNIAKLEEAGRRFLRKYAANYAT